MKAALWVLLALAIGGFFASFLFEAGFEARSSRVQLVRRESGPGSAWRTEGSPFEMLDVPLDSVVEPGRDGAAALVDVNRVNRHRPILLTSTVRQFAWLARGACLMAALCLFAGLRFYERMGAGRLSDPTEG
ncbi:MAG: hypothetical protein ACO1SV_05305 [Fimbriimonas sp.]